MINLFKKQYKKDKLTKRQEELIECFNNGIVLQVDNGKNNKKYIAEASIKHGHKVIN
jgi:hypothetical protein